MHDGTRSTGQRAIALLRVQGFAAIDSGPYSDDASFAEMADIVGRRITIYIARDGELLRATPTGTWVRDIERAVPSWPDRPYAETVEELELLLLRMGWA